MYAKSLGLLATFALLGSVWAAPTANDQFSQLDKRQTSVTIDFAALAAAADDIEAGKNFIQSTINDLNARYTEVHGSWSGEAQVQADTQMQAANDAAGTLTGALEQVVYLLRAT